MRAATAIARLSARNPGAFVTVLPDADPDLSGPAAVEAVGRQRHAVVARLIPVAVVLATSVVLLRAGGGFAPTTWYPAALFCLGLLVVTAIGDGVELRLPSRSSRVAAAALLAYAGWAFLSLLWADVPADAWQGANLTLLYALVFVIAARSRVPTRSAQWLVLAYAVAVAVVGLAVIWAAARGTADPNSGVLLGGRLAGPTSYPNATAAAFAIACWPTLALVLEETLPVLARAVALGTVASLVALNLLCQSRGSIFTLPLVLGVFLLLARRRGIALIVVGAVAVTVVSASPTLLAVYSADTAEARRDALGSALIAILVSAVVLGAAGFLLPLLDRLPRPRGRALLVIRASLALAATLAFVAVLAAASPETRARNAWHDFRHTGVPAGSSHFSGLGSNRYDFWRVGLQEFRQHPVAGIGVDNFIVPYLKRRQSDEQPLYPHSLVVRVLSQTGLVGSILLVLFFAAAMVAVLSGSPVRARTLGGGVVTGVTAWLAHGMADWLWEMPALGFAAFALLGLAVGMGRESGLAGAARRRAVWPRRLLTVTGSVVVLAAAVSFAVPWFAVRDEQRAVAGWRFDLDGSRAALDRAARLNPLSDRPYVLVGAIDGRVGALRRMRSDFEHAVSRNPVDWYAQLELAVAASATGDRAAALVAARTANELNPREEMTARVLRGIVRGHPLKPADVDRAFLEADGGG